MTNVSQVTALMAWSGGKDCAAALRDILSLDSTNVVGLMTTITREYDRVSMHGIRRVLIEKQAEALSIPLQSVLISQTTSHEEYTQIMARHLEDQAKHGVTTVAFGDIFLQDLRRYREENLARVHMRASFPNWGKKTDILARDLIGSGFKAIITCVDTKFISADFAGRLFDETFLRDLPPEVDPCGENGEFHTFVYDGPIFSNPVKYVPGERLLRDQRYSFCDLIPG